ncbi:MAG: hypothetical protein ABI647_19740 [Gemmatimonadota bacterium]
METPFKVYVEAGAKRTFAAALDWPGWSRQGPNEAEALAAMLAYGPKYAGVLAGTRLGFVAPNDPGQLVVAERLPGTAATDFGVLSVVATVDRDRSCNPAELKRFEKILGAGWNAFDRAVKAARGKTLTTGPRGGGRSVEAIVAHVIGADSGYLTAVGWKAGKVTSPRGPLAATRGAILLALEASATGRIPAHGPRGGVRWTARYFVRRVAWHTIARVGDRAARGARTGPVTLNRDRRPRRTDTGRRAHRQSRRHSGANN